MVEWVTEKLAEILQKWSEMLGVERGSGEKGVVREGELKERVKQRHVFNNH